MILSINYLYDGCSKIMKNKVYIIDNMYVLCPSFLYGMYRQVSNIIRTLAGN